MKKVKGVIRPQQKNEGGMLHGPSHEEGGIPAIVGGTTPVELEGGEYIVNAQTVNAVGQPFLDKLNSTETEYHTGGYGQGQLPNPSQFDRGGRVIKKKKLQEGGTPNPNGVVYHPGTVHRKPAHVLRESHLPCPPGMYGWKEACFQLNGNPHHTGGGNRIPGYREGGKVNSTKKMQTGGIIENQKRSNTPTRERNNRIPGRNVRQTPTSIGVGGIGSHRHNLNVDIYGNGYTTGQTHTHRIRGHEIKVSCPPDGRCHSH